MVRVLLQKSDETALPLEITIFVQSTVYNNQNATVIIAHVTLL